MNTLFILKYEAFKEVNTLFYDDIEWALDRIRFWNERKIDIEWYSIIPIFYEGPMTLCVELNDKLNRGHTI